MARHIVTFADLVAIARRVGVKVVEAPSSHRGRHGEMGTVVGCTCHHTGTPNSYARTTEYPDYNVVKEGRAGLNNSLSAYGLGRYTTIYVFSEDISWHAGSWSFNGITDGNGHLLGIEAAGIGDWTPFQRAVYPRLVASILLFIGERNPRLAAPRHMDGATPRGRKTDAAHFEQEFLPGKNFYQSVEWLMANPAYININYNAEDDMPLSQEDVDKVALRTVQVLLTGYEIPARVVDGEKVGPGIVRSFLQHTLARATLADKAASASLTELAGLRAAVEALSTAVAAGETVTADELREAVEDGIANAGAALRAVLEQVEMEQVSE